MAGGIFTLPKADQSLHLQHIKLQSMQRTAWWKFSNASLYPKSNRGFENSQRTTIPWRAEQYVHNNKTDS